MQPLAARDKSECSIHTNTASSAIGWPKHTRVRKQAEVAECTAATTSQLLWRMGRRKTSLLAAACVWHTALSRLCCFSFVCGCPSHASAVHHANTPFSLACCSLLFPPHSPLCTCSPLVFLSVLLLAHSEHAWQFRAVD
ncbi:hypothetical protein GQ54DRAFT_65754 [Martensiomyces pterosporus]|nr:hypothetical protein GQ54DRAFT_65754 [Martensiomyces pterosporus]